MNAHPSGLDLSQVDTEIRPQDDLFGFVNGAWLRDHDIPEDKSSSSEFTRLRDLSEERVRDIIMELAENGAESGSDAEKIGALYRLFMDEEKANDLGAEPLEPKLAEVSALEDRNAVARYMGRATAPIGLIALGVWNDANDPDRYMAQIFQSGIGLPDESFYREDQYAEIRDAYVDYLAHVATLANLPGREGLVAGEAHDLATAVFDFETKIAHTHVDVVRLRDREKSNNPTPSDELSLALPSFAWDAFFEGTGAKPEWLSTVNVGQPEFMEAVSPVWESADLAVVRTWLALHTVDAAAPYLSDEFVDVHFGFHGTTLSGTPQLRERWKRGVALVEGALGEAIGREYVSRHFPAAAKESMEHLVAALIAAYRESISALDWMTPETREKALAKLEKFTPKIGYPVKWRDYSGITIHDSLLKTVDAITQHEHEFVLGKLAGPVDRDEWHMYPQTVNAYYNPGANEIVFPAAILQPPYFGMDADDAVNFGGIGAVIGHEIGHGFDDQGSKFDGDGRMQSWWTSTDRAEFEARTASLIDDYEAMSPRALSNDHHVNGAFTIGENIGDLGGLSIALKAYLAEAGDAAYAVGADGYTGIQRLFLAWAVVWRAKNREADAIRRLATDPHSPAEFRANGVPRHIDAFQEAFDVREGDGMYLAPSKRVTIW